MIHNKNTGESFLLKAHIVVVLGSNEKYEIGHTLEEWTVN